MCWLLSLTKRLRHTSRSAKRMHLKLESLRRYEFRRCTQVLPIILTRRRHDPSSQRSGRFFSPDFVSTSHICTVCNSLRSLTAPRMPHKSEMHYWVLKKQSSMLVAPGNQHHHAALWVSELAVKGDGYTLAGVLLSHAVCECYTTRSVLVPGFRFLFK